MKINNLLFEELFQGAAVTWIIKCKNQLMQVPDSLIQEKSKCLNVKCPVYVMAVPIKKYIYIQACYLF